MAELVQQVARHGRKILVVLEAREIHHLLLVRLDCFVLGPEWVTAFEHLIHDEADGPNVHRFTVELPASHLLGRLIH